MNGGCVANDDISIDDTFNWNLYQLSVTVVFFLSLRSFRMLPIPNLHFYSLHSLPLPFPLSLSLWMYTTFVLCLWHVRIRCIKLLCWFLSGWLCSSSSFSFSGCDVISDRFIIPFNCQVFLWFSHFPLRFIQRFENLCKVRYFDFQIVFASFLLFPTFSSSFACNDISTKPS